MSVIKAKKAKTMEIQEFSFKEVSTFDHVNYDNKLKNLLIKKKQDPEQLKDIIKSFTQEIFVNNDDVVELEDFTDEVRKIEVEQSILNSERKKSIEEISEEELETKSVEEEQFSQPKEKVSFGSSSKSASKKTDQKQNKGTNNVESFISNNSNKKFNNVDESVLRTAAMVEDAIEDMSMNLNNSVEKVELGSKLFQEALTHPDELEEEEVDTRPRYQQISEKFSANRSQNQPTVEQGKQTSPVFDRPNSNTTNIQPIPQIPPAQLAIEEKKGFDKGYSEGFSQGEYKGYIGVSNRVDSMFSKLGELFTELANLRAQVVESMEESFVVVVDKMVRKIIRQEMSLDANILKSIFADVISKTSSFEKVKIKVNKQDYEFITKIIPDLKKEFDQLEVVSLTRDDSLSAGDFVLETPTSLIESNIEKQIANMIEGLDLSMVDKSSDERTKKAS